MDLLPAIAFLVAGLAVGLLAGWLAGARRARAAETELARARSAGDVQRARLEDRERGLRERGQQLQAREAEIGQLRGELSALREAHAGLRSDRENERKAAAEKLALLDEAEKKLREAFASLSAEALRRNNQSFLDLARAQLAEFQTRATGELEGRQKAIRDLVAPIRESLEKVGGNLHEIEKARTGAYEALREQVSAMARTQHDLQAETANLVQALRAPAVRGRWGEIQLRRVVEMAGMLDHCDFEEQPSAATETGRLRPDLRVRLPGGKSIIVDAKAPLESYLEATAAADEEATAAHLRRHARRVREHMAALGGKAYWSQFQPGPEFVVMFLPGETFFSAALRHDPALIEYGVDQHVIPASPTTLIALLRAVAYGWQQERIAANAQQISELGRDLYDRIRVLAGHFDDIRKNLDQTVEAHNKAVGSLERRVLVSARRFKELGAGTAEEIPELQPVERATRGVQAEELVGDAEGPAGEAEGAAELEGPAAGRPAGEEDLPERASGGSKAGI